MLDFILLIGELQWREHEINDSLPTGLILDSSALHHMMGNEKNYHQPTIWWWLSYDQIIKLLLDT